jgi:acyl-CoA synthetase (AMP-forming)/AMP-acid ligase II
MAGSRSTFSGNTTATGQRIFRSTFPDFEASGFKTGFRTNAWSGGVARRAEELKPYHPTLLHAFATAAKHETVTGITLIRPAEERHQPDTEEHLSYRELYHRALRIAGGLGAHGVRAGDRVLVVLPTGFELIATFFAIELLGAVPVPTYPPTGLRLEMAIDRLCHVARASGSRLCITDEQIHPFLGELVLKVPTVDKLVNVENLQVSTAKPPKDLRAGGSDPAFIQYTSGSTGHPKGVLLTHTNLVSNIHAIGQALRINRGDVTVSWLPLYHDMGLIGTLLFSIYWRIPLVLMDPTSFLMKPSRWLHAITRHKGTLSPAPNFAYALCVRRIKPEERVGLDLSSWRMAMNGAEPVNFRTLRAFHEIFGEHGFCEEAMLPVYGLAEASLAVTFPDPGAPPRCEVVDRDALANGTAVSSTGKGSFAVVSVGKPVPGHEVVVVTQEGEVLPEREVGHILVRGPSLMAGYYNDEQATDAVLRDGWLWTGDLGFIADGELYVTGRAKDLIILRGRNIYAEDLERVAERVDGTRPGGAYAFGVYDEVKAIDLVVMVVETKLGSKEEHEALVTRVSEMVMEMTEVKLDEVVLVAPGTVPKTSSGKKQRALCRELYLKHELKAPPSRKMAVGLFYVRSRAGFLLAGAKRLLGRKLRAPA